MTAERTLRTDVYVGGVRYRAGTPESETPAELITNPRAWSDFVDPDAEADLPWHEAGGGVRVRGDLGAHISARRAPEIEPGG